jgi:hypothetical protein
MTASRIADLEAAARELDRWSLVIESAVRCDAPRDHLKVMAALQQLRAALSAPAAPESAPVEAIWHSLDDNGLAELRVRGMRITSFPSYGAAHEAAQRINAALGPVAASPPPAALGVEEVARELARGKCISCGVPAEGDADGGYVACGCSAPAWGERTVEEAARAVVALLPRPEPEGAGSVAAETVKIILREMGSALFDELVSRGVDAELIVQAVEACADRSEAEIAAIRAKEEGL